MSMGSGAEVSTLAPVPRSTDGSSRSLENAFGGTVPRVDANFGKFVGYFIVSPFDVNEFEAMELIFKFAYFLAVSLYFWVMAARGFQDLVDDQLGVALNVEASDPELDSDP